MECIAFVKRGPWANWLTPSDYGWGNGYVAVPEGHPYHGMHYDDVPSEIEAHGGLTFSELADDSDWFPEGTKGMWIFGFDTGHYGDNLEKWPEHAVLAAANRLKDQLEAVVLQA